MNVRLGSLRLVSSGFISCLARYFLLFYYILNVTIPFIPPVFKSRLVIGLFFFIVHVRTKVPQKYFSIIYCCILATFLSIYINGTSDFWFLIFYIQQLLTFYGAFGVVSFISPSSHLILVKMIINVALFNNLIAFVGLLFLPIKELILSLQNLQLEGSIKDVFTFGVRALGFGIGNFFTGGVLTGACVIFSAYLVAAKALSPMRGAINTILLIGTGIFIARTSLIGFILSFSIILSLKIGKIKINSLYYSLSIMLFVFIAALLFLTVISSFIDVSWALELFFNLFDGNVETSSTEHMYSMYVFPDNFSTWVIGDALFESEGIYYKGTDIGYLRVLFYGGILGLIPFMLLQISLLKACSKMLFIEGCKKTIFVTLFIFILVLNFKGFTDINYLLYLLFAYGYYKSSYCLSNYSRI